MASEKKDMSENLIDLLNVKRVYNGCRPKNPYDRSVIDMQIQIAKIILRDAYKVQEKHPERDFSAIINSLTCAWKDNIKSFAMALLVLKDD